MFTLFPSISAWSTRWLFSPKHKDIGVKAVKRALSRGMATNTKIFYYKNFYKTHEYNTANPWNYSAGGHFTPPKINDMLIGQTVTTDNVTHWPTSKTSWASLKPFKVPNFDLSFGHVFKDKEYFIRLHEKQVIEKNLLKEQLVVLRKEIKETDRILASLPANPRQPEGPEVLDVQAGLRQKKAVITSHVDEYAVVDLHAGPREMDDVALQSTESLASSWRTKLTKSAQSLWSGKFWSGEATAPVTSDGFSLVDVRDDKAVVTDTVLTIAKPVVYPQEARLATSSEMEPLPAGMHWPAYLEETYPHFFFVFESALLFYPVTHAFLLIIALFFQGHCSVFINLCGSLYMIITFSLSFVAQIFLFILGNYINLFYVIWFEYAIFTFRGNLKVQKTYLFLPSLERLYVFKSEPQVMVYIGLKTDW